MSPPILPRTCLLFALRRESHFVRRALKPTRRVAAPCWAAWCGTPPVLLLETGVGVQRVDRALDWLLSGPVLDGARYYPDRLVFAGFAGSLSPALKIGDVLTAAEVVTEAGLSWQTSWPAHRLGRLLTTDRLIATVLEKHQLGQRFEACAVDMESAACAHRCHTAGLPFACVRAISDAVDMPLSPLLLPLLSAGVISPWRFALTLARHPGLLPELLRLARHTKLASRQLGACLTGMLYQQGSLGQAPLP